VGKSQTVDRPVLYLARLPDCRPQRFTEVLRKHPQGGRRGDAHERIAKVGALPVCCGMGMSATMPYIPFAPWLM